jgi:hypothetical protein
MQPDEYEYAVQSSVGRAQADLDGCFNWQQRHTVRLLKRKLIAALQRAAVNRL